MWHQKKKEKREQKEMGLNRSANLKIKTQYCMKINFCE